MLHRDERDYLVKLARNMQKVALQPAPALGMPGEAGMPTADPTLPPPPRGGPSFGSRVFNRMAASPITRAIDRSPLAQASQNSTIGQLTYDHPGAAAGLAIPLAALGAASAPASILGTMAAGGVIGASGAAIGDSLDRASAEVTNNHAVQNRPYADTAKNVALSGLAGGIGAGSGNLLSRAAGVGARAVPFVPQAGSAVSNAAVPPLTRFFGQAMHHLAAEGAPAADKVIGRAVRVGEDAAVNEAAGLMPRMAGAFARTTKPATELYAEHGAAAPTLEHAFGHEGGSPQGIAQGTGPGPVARAFGGVQNAFSAVPTSGTATAGTPTPGGLTTAGAQPNKQQTAPTYGTSQAPMMGQTVAELKPAASPYTPAPTSSTAGMPTPGAPPLKQQAPVGNKSTIQPF